jgi:hypothetical protein
MTSRIIICIPTSLKQRKDLASALESKYGAEYVFIGRVFQSNIDRISCEIDIFDICAANPVDNPWVRRSYHCYLNLTDTFKLAGQDKLDASTLQQIDQHQQVIYLTSSSTGYASCRQIAQLAQVILQVGGIAIKVESAGIAHYKDKWLANYNSDDVFDIYSLFVTLVEGDDSYYSCGMHNFGKADVAVDLSEDMSLAIYVMNVFNYYRLTESAILQAGHTFQPDIECPKYKIEWTMDREYEIHSPQYNPHGRWHLIVSS